MIVGTLLLALFAHTPTVALVAIACFLVGVGMGLSAVPTLIAAQASVPWHERGVVTGTNMFARSIGSAVGVAVFGAVANTYFGSSTAEDLEPSVMIEGTSAVLIGVVIVAVGGLMAGLAMPKTPVAVAEPEPDS